MFICVYFFILFACQSAPLYSCYPSPYSHLPLHSLSCSYYLIVFTLHLYVFLSLSAQSSLVSMVSIGCCMSLTCGVFLCGDDLNQAGPIELSYPTPPATLNQSAHKDLRGMHSLSGYNAVRPESSKKTPSATAAAPSSTETQPPQSTAAKAAYPQSVYAAKVVLPSATITVVFFLAANSYPIVFLILSTL